MFPNWTGWKTTKLVLATVAAGAAGIAAAHLGAVSDYASTVGTIDGTLLAIVITLSGTALGPTIGKPRGQEGQS